MNWLALLAALSKLASAIASAFRDRSLLSAGEARGRAAADAEHARTAAEAGARMREIAVNPSPRAVVDKRLEEGSA
jgi:hypothetical protein